MSARRDHDDDYIDYSYHEEPSDLSESNLVPSPINSYSVQEAQVSGYTRLEDDADNDTSIYRAGNTISHDNQDPSYFPVRSYGDEQHPPLPAYEPADDTQGSGPGEDETRNHKGYSFIRSKLSVIYFWKWEIVSLGISIILIVAICAVLATSDGRQTSTWTFPLNLTALVALLSTVSRVLIATVMAEVIAQSKWSWFWNASSTESSRVRPLMELEAFNQASQGGIWGSLQLFKFANQKPALLLSLLVLLTSAAMGPFAQQAIRTVICESIDETQSASIPTVHHLGYHGGINIQPYLPSSYLSQSVKAGIVASLVNPDATDSDIQTTCSTGNCTFPVFKDEKGREFTHKSVGFCSHCVDVSSFIERKQPNIADDSDKRKTQYLPNQQNISCLDYHDTVYRVVSSKSMDLAAGFRDFSGFEIAGKTTLNLSWAKKALTKEFLDLSQFALINTSMLISPNPCNETLTTAAVCTIYPCIQSYIASIEKGKLIETAISSQLFSPLGSKIIPMNGTGYRTDEEHMAFPVQMYRAQRPCYIKGVEYTESNLTSGAETTSLTGYSFNNTSPFYVNKFIPDNEAWINLTAPPECFYAIERRHWFKDLASFLRDDALTGACYQDGSSMGNVSVQVPTTPICYPYWLETISDRSVGIDDAQTFMEAFTRSLNRRFRQGMDGVSTNFSLHESASVPVRGMVRRTTTCFVIDWRWLIFPLTLVGLSSVLFLWALLRDRLGYGNGEMIWKSSILPLLYYKDRFVVADHGKSKQQFVGEDREDLMDLKELDNAAKRTRVGFQG